MFMICSIISATQHGPSWMEQALESSYSSYLSQLPFVVRIPVPQAGVTGALEAMHAAAASIGGPDYAASPFRDFSDPWNPGGAFRWHFASAEAARWFAVRFSGKLVTRR
jgi:hypothetical protein